MINKAFLSRASLFGLVLLAFSFFPLSSGAKLPFWFHEHFFNTLQIVQGKMLPTNDFSPVWGSLLAGYLSLFKTPDFSFFCAVYATLAAAGIATLFLFSKLFKALDLPLTENGRFTVGAFALALYLQTAVSGTDAALAVPAVLLFALLLLRALQTPSFAKSFLAGLALSFMVLTRFDTAGFIITFALVFYFQFNGKEPISVKSFAVLLAGLLIGALPLAAFWYWEKQTLGSFVPGSVQSWTQSQGTTPWKMLGILLWEPIRYITYKPTAVALQTFPVLLIFLAAYHSFPWKKREQTAQDCVFYSLVWFPVFQMAALALFTFILVPEYAFYPLAVGTPGALAYAISRITANVEEKDRRMAEKSWLMIGLCALIIGVYMPARTYDASYDKAADALKTFSKTHPGLYAMSSGAAAASFKSEQPFIRLDGLAADQQMQTFLNAQTDLEIVLKQYQVDYYVAVNLTKGQECYSVREPKQNRFGTNKSLSGWLCQEPVATLTVTQTLELQIFDVSSLQKPAE